MKRITEVINQLLEIQEKHGDIEILINDSSWDEVEKIKVETCPITKQYCVIINIIIWFNVFISNTIIFHFHSEWGKEIQC